MSKNAAKRQIFRGLSFSPPAGGEKIVRANLRIVHRYFNNEKILDDLRKVAKKLGKKNVSFREYMKYGTFSTAVFRNRFGSWNRGLQKAGLNIIRESKLSDEQLFQNLEKIWRKLGRQPCKSDNENL